MRYGLVRIAAVASVCLAFVAWGSYAPRPVPVAIQLTGHLKPAPTAQLWAGAARVEITPPVLRGVELAGYAPRRTADPGADNEPLFARALVLETRPNRAIALVTLETLIVPAEFAARAEAETRAALARLGVRLDGFFLHATHTHSGEGHDWDNAAAAFSLIGPFRQATVDRKRRGVVEAVRRAWAARRPAVLTTGTVPPRVPELANNENRRLRALTDEDQQTWPAGFVPMEFAWSADDSLVWARLIDAEAATAGAAGDAAEAAGTAAETLATLAVYSAHPTVLGRDSRALSGDWPGALALALEARDGGVALVFSGALGDVGPRTPGAPPGASDRVRLASLTDDLIARVPRPNRSATALGPGAPARAPVLAPQPPVLDAVTVRYALPMLDAPMLPEDLRPLRVLLSWYADLRWFPDEAKLRLVRLGDLVLAGLPGEPSDAHARRFRQAVELRAGQPGRPRHAAYVAHVGGWFGYTLDELAYTRGRPYEEVFTFYGPSLGDAWCRATIEMLPALDPPTVTAPPR